MRVSSLVFVLLSLVFSISAQAVDIYILEANSIEPYAIQNKEPKVPDSGAEIDIFNAVFAGTKFRPQFKFVPLLRVSKDIYEERMDGSARMGESSEKGFLTDPYIRYSGCVITLKDKPDIKSIKELRKMSIVAFQGANGAFGKEFEDAVKDNKQYREMNNQQSQIALLTLSRIDAIVADLYITRYKQDVISREDNVAIKDVKCAYSLYNEPYRAFFKEKQFVDIFNTGLKRILADGTYDKILQKYNMKNELTNKK